jgi:hypothetical protein
LELLAARVADHSSDDGTGLVLYSVIVVVVAVLLLVKVIVWAKKLGGAPVSAANKYLFPSCRYMDVDVEDPAGPVLTTAMQSHCRRFLTDPLTTMSICRALFLALT